MGRQSIDRERAVSIVQVALAASVIVLAAVEWTVDPFTAIVYVSFAIVMSLLVWIGRTVKHGRAWRFGAAAIGGVIAVVGGAIGWQIDFIGGRFWWGLLLVLAVVAAWLELSTPDRVADSPIPTETGSRLRWRVVVAAAQLLFAGLCLVSLPFALSGPFEYNGLLIPVLLGLAAAFSIAAAAYWSGLRLPVLALNVPLVLYAIDTAGHHVDDPGRPDVVWFVGWLAVAVIAAFCTVAAIKGSVERAQAAPGRSHL